MECGTHPHCAVAHEDRCADQQRICPRWQLATLTKRLEGLLLNRASEDAMRVIGYLGPNAVPIPKCMHRPDTGGFNPLCHLARHSDVIDSGGVPNAAVIEN